ncbi:lipid IV(A) 3-deoxy-D-manno-octulosonic acid transferase [Campylobacter ureolyticus]|uniref:3-deoxy-D-manno-octulosonic acid transferase n=1 Tax=Campylobacter ureolyticus TaxID=827 RepID=A0A9Q4PSE6_9BACT|nr:lipid IV(A) 3-deoxy-D-manno-octulosonic acid transferase [Campylobacter ureolyticus]MCZ6160133.1 lipid IV(A) 3-deoxy-D-manno-octulosonic acid transferase [Campylobacter ureolyticus]MCZ6163950.1 lipid IV(A) 3-deoxy-D-manno-octulosonic acid transferase [Campylobacter ureolyticus]MCZ6165919.1 lipid IV(A) 3-deoxy-D-manno-octulosonic acid transferase [Campylobacter ureolyticus]MCZ6167391.1 lipid IV(A) 3-deoxy-D-manno-octulosonic acid transferase [Campylobacter ureolyticus]MCZ6186116.1 lipid IV(A
MFYNLFSFFIWLFLTPFILVFSFKKKYKKSLPARFFLYKNPPLKKADVHFHACSFGEISALETLALKFESFSFTTTTATGFEKAKSLNENTRFLPFECFIPFWLTKSKVLVVFEAELWLNLVKTAKKNGSYVILLNARISDRSYKRYEKFKFYYKEIFKYIDLVLAQSNLDKTRLLNLGAKNIEVVGNIKSANFKPATKNYPKFSEFLVIIASTHEDEEELILNNITPNENQKFIIAPRHPERFCKVAKICEDFAKKFNLKFEKFSQNLGFKSNIILLDAMNEVINFYKISDVVILGGSFIDGIGGHNPIEIAQFNKPLINGYFYHNQKALFELVDGVNFSDLSNLNELLSSNLSKTVIKNKADLQSIENLIKIKIKEQNGC